MDENSRLKKYIDLYIEAGADNEYLYDKLVKAFNNASPEENKEGHEYLNCRLQEQRKNGRYFSKEQSKNYKWIFGLALTIIVAAIVVINLNDSSNYNTKSNYTSNYSSDSIKNTNNSSTSCYCDASSCIKKGIYSIDGVSGKEYYCYEHYKQMERWAEMIMGY